MIELIPEVIRPYMNAILIGIGGMLLAFIATKIVSRLLLKALGKGWSKFVGNLVGYGIVVWILKILLDLIGAEGLIVVVITALTVAFALGSERYAGDFVSGISLLVLKGFELDDEVQLAGIDGRVVSISLMMTILEDEEGDRFYIRNSDATGGLIVKYAPHTTANISVNLAIPVTQDITVAVAAIEKAVQGFSSPELDDPALQPVVVAAAAADGYFNLEVQAVISVDLDEGSEKTRLFMLALKAIQEAGLTL